MKKNVIILVTIGVVIAMVAGITLLSVEEDKNPENTEVNFGEELYKIEEETISVSKEITEGLKSGVSIDTMGQKVSDAIDAMTENIDKINNEDVTDKVLLRTMYGAALIRRLAQITVDKEPGQHTEAELALKKHELTKFANELFSYCMDLNQGTVEKDAWKGIKSKSEDIEKNKEKLYLDFMESVKDWSEEKT